MARQSLNKADKGTSPLISFRSSPEVSFVLDNLDHANKSQFIRDAILFYARHGGSLQAYTPATTPSPRSPSDDSAEAVSVSNTPPWKR